jgi:hypothetical protein
MHNSGCEFLSKNGQFISAFEPFVGDWMMDIRFSIDRMTLRFVWSYQNSYLIIIIIILEKISYLIIFQQPLIYENENMKLGTGWTWKLTCEFEYSQEDKEGINKYTILVRIISNLALTRFSANCSAKWRHQSIIILYGRAKSCKNLQYFLICR